jgi:hypothetical protein
MPFQKLNSCWLVTQCSWHPALPIFPANREFYKELVEYWTFVTSETLKCPVNASLLMKIPYAAKQGTISAQQGFLAQEQGIESVSP